MIILPSNTEYDEALRNLDRVSWSVDYIITHCAPTRIQTLADNGSYAPEHLTDFLETISERSTFQKWYCGHYHQNRIIENKYFLLYDELARWKRLIRSEGHNRRKYCVAIQRKSEECCSP